MMDVSHDSNCGGGPPALANQKKSVTIHTTVPVAPTTYAQQQQSRLMRIPPFDVNSSEMLRAIVIAMCAIRPDASTASEIKTSVQNALLAYQPLSDVYDAYEDSSCYSVRTPSTGFEDPRTPTTRIPTTTGSPAAEPLSIGSADTSSQNPVDKIARFPFLVPGGIVELVDFIMEAIGDRYIEDTPIAVGNDGKTMTRLAATALMVCEEARQHWKRAHTNVIRDLLPFLRTSQAVVVLGSGQLLGKILARGAMECVRFYILEGSPELPAERMRRKERDRDRKLLSGVLSLVDEDDCECDDTISNQTATYRSLPTTARGEASKQAPASSPFVAGWDEEYVVRGRGSGVNLLNEVQFQAAKLCGLLPTKKGEKMSVDAQERLETVMGRVSKSCVIVPDSLMASVLGMSDFSLVGAYGVTESGGIVHRNGSYQLALLSKALNKPLYVACESFKFTREKHCYPSASVDIAQPQTLQEAEERAVLASHIRGRTATGAPVDSPSSSEHTVGYASLGRAIGVQPSSAVSEQLRKSMRRLACDGPTSPLVSPKKVTPEPVVVAPVVVAHAPKPSVRRGKNNTAAPHLKVDLNPKKGPEAAESHNDDARSDFSDASAAVPPQSPLRRKIKSFHSSSVHMIDRLEEEAMGLVGGGGSVGEVSTKGSAGTSGGKDDSYTRKEASGKSTSKGGMGARSVSHSHFSVTDTTNRRAGTFGASGSRHTPGSGGNNFRPGGGFTVPQSPYLHSSSKADVSGMSGSVNGMFPLTPASGMQGLFPQNSADFLRTLSAGNEGRTDSSPDHHNSGSRGVSVGNSPAPAGGPNMSGELHESPMPCQHVDADPFFAFAQPWDSAPRAPPPMLELVPNDLLTLFFTDKALMPPAGIVHQFYKASGNNKWWQDVVKPASA